MSSSKKTKKIPPKKRTRIIEVAHDLRKTLFKNNEPVDPEALLDALCEKIKDFDWFVGDDHFSGMNDVVAFAKFDDGRHIYLKEDVYDALRKPGTQKYARACFIVCHEIAHILLHFRSRKPLARNKLGSRENYASDELKEMEANLFSGSLMIPCTTLDTGLSQATVSQYYRTSYTVAAKALRDAEFYKQYKKK